MGVGVEEEEEDHAESHQVHVDEEEDSAVVEVPAALHAADGVGCAGESDEGGKDEHWRGAITREAGDEDSRDKTRKNQEAGSNEGSLARIEKGDHARLPVLQA